VDTRRHPRTRPSRRNALADAITRFSGSFAFIMLHALWFTTWIVRNEIPAMAFDPYPFGPLTLVVSLEAIFLSTFVLMSQNRAAQREDERADQDFHTNVWTEAWVEMIGKQLGVDDAAVRRRAEQKIRHAKREQDKAEAA
jgi:uncharacterized membrane protein